MFKKLGLILSVLITSGTSYAETLDSIQERGHINLAIFPNDHLLSEEINGRYEGFFVDIGREISKRLFKTEDEKFINFVEITSGSERFQLLKSDEADIIVSAITANSSRRKEFGLTHPIYRSRFALMSKRNNEVSQSDLENGSKKIMVFSGSGADTFIKKNYPNANTVSCKGNDCVDKFINDDEIAGFANIDLWVYTKVVQSKDLVVSIPSFGTSSYASLAVSKNNTTLLDWLNQTLNDMKEDGTLLKIYNKNLEPHFSNYISADKFLRIRKND